MKYGRRGSRHKYKQGAGGRKEEFTTYCRKSTGAACDENPISHAEPSSFIGYESFRRLSAPQAKVNTDRGERATRHRHAENYHSALLSLYITA